MQPAWHPPPTPAREHTSGEKIGLAIAFLGNTFVLITSILAASRASSLFGDDPDVVRKTKRLLLFAALMAVLRLVCIAGIWAWKRWGIVGYATLGIVGMFLAHRTNGRVQAGTNALLVAIVVLSVASRWAKYD